MIVSPDAANSEYIAVQAFKFSLALRGAFRAGSDAVQKILAVLRLM